MLFKKIDAAGISVPRNAKAVGTMLALKLQKLILAKKSQQLNLSGGKRRDGLFHR